MQVDLIYRTLIGCSFIALRHVTKNCSITVVGGMIALMFIKFYQISYSW